MNIDFIVDHHKHGTHHFGGNFNLRRVVPRNNHVQWFILPLLGLCVIQPAPRALFDGAFAANGNFTARLVLHLLLSFAPGANDEPYKVVGGVFVYRNGNFDRALSFGDEGRQHRVVQRHELLEAFGPFFGVLLLPARRSRVLPRSIGVVDGRRRGRAIGVTSRQGVDACRLPFEVGQA